MSTPEFVFSGPRLPDATVGRPAPGDAAAGVSLPAAEPNTTPPPREGGGFRIAGGNEVLHRVQRALGISTSIRATDLRRLVLHFDTESSEAGPAARVQVEGRCFGPATAPLETVIFPDPKRFVVGSSRSCEVRIDSPVVSPNHAEVRWHDGCFRVSKIGGSPLFLNELALPDDGRDRPMLPGDVLSFGAIHNSWLRLQYGDAALRLAATTTRNLHYAAAQQLYGPEPDGQPIRSLQIDEQTMSHGACLGGHWVGLAWMRGDRTWQEDRAVARHIEGTGIPLEVVGVFDGHGGDAVAELAAEELPELLSEALAAGDPNGGGIPAAAIRAFETLDTWLGPDGGGIGMECGSTAAIICISGDELYALNVGDSRTVLYAGGVAQRLSWDQKADDPKMARAIERSGGRIVKNELFPNAPARVNGVLAMSNAIGDHDLGKVLSRRPEISHLQLADDAEFLILGSDGLWDTVGDAAACRVVASTLARCTEAGTSPDITACTAAAALRDHAYRAGSDDNITAAVVCLRRPLDYL